MGARYGRGLRDRRRELTSYAKGVPFALDGIELLARLRGTPETSTLPVILLSARAGEYSSRRVPGGEETRPLH